MIGSQYLSRPSRHHPLFNVASRYVPNNKTSSPKNYYSNISVELSGENT
jgi:hypothetical protein